MSTADRKSAGTAWRRARWFLAGGGLLVLAGLLVAVWLLRLVAIEQHVGFFGPAFAADGRSVYFVERRTRGLIWGLGWEHFTPPAHARVWSDSLRLQCLDLQSGAVLTLETWDGSPVVRRTLRQYRGRVFNDLKVALRPRQDGSVDYGFELALPRVPTAEVHQLRGVWTAGGQQQRGKWDGAAFAVVGLSEPVIDGERELFALRGAEGFPAALVLLDHADNSMRVLRRGPSFDGQYPDGPSHAALMTVSGKARHDRIEELKRIERERLAVHRAQGLNEGAAMLQAGRDLRDLGFYPKPQRWVATLLTPQQVGDYTALPRLDIADMEFTVGLFPDLEQAMAAPATEIDKGFSRYLRHRDYDTSERLNALLAAGTAELLIGRAGRVFHFRLLPAEPAVRGPGQAAK